MTSPPRKKATPPAAAPVPDSPPEPQAAATASSPPPTVPPPERPQPDQPSPLRDQLADKLQAQRRLDSQLRVTFFVTLALGLTGGALGDWVTPTIAVCAYAVIGWMITRNEENIDRFADSLYYMGFLFTIWGLLFAFGPWTAVENLSSTTILTQFGIKLITTVIALTARIILLQARHSLAEVTEETQDTLGALAKVMTREIEQSIEEFRKSRDRLVAQADQGLTQSHSEAVRQLALTMSEFQRQTHNVLENVHGATATLLAQIKAITVPPDVLAIPLTVAAEGLATETERLRTSIHEAGAGIAQSLTQSLEHIQQSTRGMDTAVKGLKDFERLAGVTDSAAKTMTGANAALQETFEQTKHLVEEVTRVVARLQNAAGEDVTRIRTAIESTSSGLRDLGDTIRQDAEKYSAALTQSIRLLRGEIERR